MNPTEELNRLLDEVLEARTALSGTVLPRIDASVVRPLCSLVERPEEISATPESRDNDSNTADQSEALWRLAQQATSVFKTLGGVEVFEAAAALQDLAYVAAESDAAAQETKGIQNGDRRGAAGDPAFTQRPALDKERLAFNRLAG